METPFLARVCPGKAQAGLGGLSLIPGMLPSMRVSYEEGQK